MDFTPSDYQAAVFHWIEKGRGNAIINAVAGSGKTTTLVEAAKRIPEGDAIFVAFNKIIVSELSGRLPSSMQCSTIHRLGLLSLYKFYGRKSNVDEDKYSKIVSPFAAHIHEHLDMEYRKKKVVYDAFIAKEKKGSKLTQSSGWDRYSNLTVGDLVQEVTEPFAPPHTAIIAQQLKELIRFVRLRLVNGNSPDEILHLINHFGLDIEVDMKYVYDVVPKILSEGIEWANESGVIDFDDMVWLPYIFNLQPLKFGWVLVDEAQDLNPAQLNFVLKMVKTGGRMLFVGDPKQAIYGFAGADPDSFYTIQECVNAKEFPLSICYRCPKSVVELAKAIVPAIETFPNAKAGIVEEVSEKSIEKRLQKSDFIICRFTAPLISLCIELIGKRIPAKVLGRDIGRQLNEIIKAVTYLKGYSYQQFPTYLKKYKSIRESKLRAYNNAEERIRSLDDRIRGIEKCFYSFKNCRDANMLCKEIDNLFADSLSTITLSTIHKAKGREFERVFILDYDEMPLEFEGQQDWQFEQETNLQYVAITRAKKELYLVKGEKEPPRTTAA